nr:lysylphosphatidylglycerol synthase domain-containing protein [Candidatus Nanopelagicales bacterium]
ERVQHEAMISLLAQRAGVPVPPVVTSGQAAQGEALLVTAAPGRALADLPPESIDDAWLGQAWGVLATLHEAGIAHRTITGRHLVQDPDGSPALADFVHARLAASEHEVMIDRVHLLVTLALAVGNDRAVGSAVEALGVAGLTSALPYVQDPVLSAPLRRAMGPAWDLEELRTLAIERTGAEAAPLVELRRVTVGSFVKLLLGVVIASSLIGLLAGVDLAAVVEELSAADYRLLLLGLLVAPLAQVLFTFSTLGASLRRLPYLPVLMLQYAIQFIALVLPATAARIALQIRFFERLGVSYGAATSMGAIDGFGGFVVQVLLLLLIGLSSLPGFTTAVDTGSDSGSEESGDPSLLALAVLIGLVWTVVTLAVPRRRARVRREVPRFIHQMRDQASQARSSLHVLRHPSKVLGILGGNLGGQVVQAVVLGICLAAFDESASLSQLILVNTVVSLFAGMLPVPGGVGVAEAGYTYGLQAIGVPSAIAVSTAIAFRLVTFYLPPLWCSQAMSWLRRNAYV